MKQTKTWKAHASDRPRFYLSDIDLLLRTKTLPFSLLNGPLAPRSCQASLWFPPLKRQSGYSSNFLQIHLPFPLSSPEPNFTDQARWGDLVNI